MNQSSCPLISVILPCYNAELYLRKAIESILNQTYSNFELIAIDDGSTDSTFQILEEYSKNDSRIRLYRNDENIKLIKTLNNAIELACGEYIARMDADDISSHKRFEVQLNFFKNNPQVDLVSTGYHIINENGKVLAKSIPRQKSSQGCFFASFFYVPVGHPEIMIKTSILKENRYLFDECVLHTEDYELWSRLLRKGFVLQNIEECVHYFRINNNSVSRKFTNIQDENFVECAKIHYFQYTSKQLPVKIIRVLVNRITNDLELGEFKKGIKEIYSFKSYFIKKENIVDKIILKEIQTVFYTHLFDICFQSIKKCTILIKIYATWILLINCKIFFYKDVLIYLKNKI